MTPILPDDGDTFGRGPQLRAVLPSDARLRTVVGPGRIGKTTSLRRLATLTSDTGLPVVVCDLIGNLTKRLVRRGELLLVLDNLEQLVSEGGVERIAAWVVAAPRHGCVY